MSVNRNKILLKNMGISGGTIEIPLRTDFFPIDNAELLQDKFVDEEKEKSINPIEDYKKIIFRPADENWEIIDKFKIKLNFYTPDSISNGSPQHRGYPNSTNVAGVYSDINFTFDDIFCRTNRFLFSYLSLFFYDNPNSGDNQVFFFSNIYTQIMEDQKNSDGFVKPATECPVSFVVGDPVLQPDLSHESYHIYWFQDLVDNSYNGEYELYMTAIFNNASNGQAIMMASSKLDPSAVQLNELNGEEGALYLKVILKNDNGVYKYRFEPNDKQKPPPDPGGVDLNPTLGGAPTIIFWQILP